MDGTGWVWSEVDVTQPAQQIKRERERLREREKEKERESERESRGLAKQAGKH